METIFLNDKIEKLNISNRLRNVLRRTGIDTVEKLIQFPEDEWPGLPNIGSKTLDEIFSLIDGLKKGTEEYILYGYEPEEELKEEVDEESVPIPADFFEKSIDEMDFSRRAYNCLMRTGITDMSQLVTMTKDELMNIKNMGVGTVNEILQKVKVFENNIRHNAKLAVDIPEEILKIADECADAYEVSTLKIRNLLGTILKEIPCTSNDAIVYLAYSDEYLKTAAKNKILSILKKLNEEISINDLREYFPSHLFNTTVLEELLLELECDKKIWYRNDFYAARYPTVMEYIEGYKRKDVVVLRLEGKTFEDVGAKFGMTRERIRQLCAKAFEDCDGKTLEEDKYRSIFEKYELNCEDFCQITGEPARTFYYLEIVCDTRGKKREKLKEMLKDETLTIETKRRAEAIVYRDFIVLDGMRIRKNRSDLFEYVVKKFCREITSYSDVVVLYREFIEEHGLSDNKKLEIDDRSYQNKLQACDYVLWSWNHSFRYYDTAERDYTQMIEKLNFKQYSDITFTTLKLFRENPELMEEYDIRDEYELHNLLKKIWPEWGDCEVVFSKMPTIIIGDADKDNQVIDLLLKYAPISAHDLADKFEEMYGFRSSTSMGVAFNCIDNYFHNGIYSIEFESLTMQQSSRMSEVLTEDFYSVDDFTRILKREFPDAKDSLVNSYNIKNLGFSFNDSYLIRKTYASSLDYFRFRLLEKEIVDTRDFPNAMLSSVSYSTVKYDLREKRTITEFSPGQYINISRLNEVGVTKENLEKYCEEIKNFVAKNTFFTIQSIRKEGFDSSLHELYFDDWFYSSIAVEDKEHFSYVRCGGTRLMRLGKEKFTLPDFIAWLVERESKIDIYDLEKLCREYYGVVIDRYKLLSVAKNAGLYYDEIMETVYIDYDTYFEEV